MLTIFTIPKPFVGRTAVQQRNAIGSWRALRPECQVIVAGSDEGVAEAAASLGAEHLPIDETTPHGTPLLAPVFRRVQAMARFDPLCYVNADVMFADGLLAAVRHVHRPRYLLTGRRWNVDLSEPLDFTAADWGARLRALATSTGTLAPPFWLDYFVFTRGLFDAMPAFAVGRPKWDNWILFAARRQGVPVIDATAAIVAVHQNHDYDHIPDAEGELWRGPEASENERLYQQSLGEYHHLFGLDDATWRLTPSGLRRNVSWRGMRRLRRTFPLLYPGAARWVEPLWRVFKRVRGPARERSE